MVPRVENWSLTGHQCFCLLIYPQLQPETLRGIRGPMGNPGFGLAFLNVEDT